MKKPDLNPEKLQTSHDISDTHGSNIALFSVCCTIIIIGVVSALHDGPTYSHVVDILKMCKLLPVDHVEYFSMVVIGQ